MKLIDRYLIRQFVVPFLFCLAAFVLVYVIYDLSAHLDNYVEDQIPFSVVLRYYVIQMPLVLVTAIIPLSILLAMVYSLGGLSRHNEITAMRANGISLYRILSPFLVLGLGFTMLLLYLNECFAPAAYEKSEQLIDEYDKDHDDGERVVQLAFYNPVAGRTWTGRWASGSTVFTDVSVRNFEEGRVTEKISARESCYIKEEGEEKGEWWFQDGAVQHYDSEERPLGQEIPFGKRRFAFEETPEDFLSSQKDSASMGYIELRRNMRFFPADTDIYRRKLVDLYYKLAFPFIGFTIILIAFPLAIKASRGGAVGSVGVCIALVIFYYTISIISIALGHGGVFPPIISAWLPNLVMGALGSTLIYRSR
jgi:lipopolysaccharide export system permease protein